MAWPLYKVDMVAVCRLLVLCVVNRECHMRYALARYYRVIIS